FYGYRRDNRQTPGGENEYLLEWCRLYRENGVSVLVTDYCSDRDKMDDSRRMNGQNGFISFAAPERELNVIPSYSDPLPGENGRDINVIADARNFLYLINGEKFRSRAEFLAAVEKTDYDLIIMDLFFENEALSPGDLDRIRSKQNGGKRLLICYMSIGEAEDYRYYWKTSWKKSPPEWIEEENPDWEGNYKVRYWDAGWQSLIFGNPDAYLDRILAAGFDGVYLDIIDAFEYFE
ncbi:MAG: endo alpha-1,4 polygalactosaminidase, partial [Sediminispirochaetaceae bacterium]